MNKLLWFGAACLVLSVIFGASSKLAFSQSQQPPPPQNQLQTLSCPYGYYLATNYLCYPFQSRPTNATQSPSLSSSVTSGNFSSPMGGVQSSNGTNTTNGSSRSPTSIMGLNAQNIQNYEFNLGRIADIAKLPNATNATLDTFANQKQVLTCVQLYFSLSEIADCNDLLTGYLTNNELGNNQTMIKIAKAYLKLSGIQ